MDELFEVIREECSKLIWSRAVQLSRSGTIAGKKTHNDEIELRITTKGGMVSPLVVLSPKYQDWSCECLSNDAVCVHVAAAVIALRHSNKEKDAIPVLEVPSVKIAYRLESKEGYLTLRRLVIRGKEHQELKTRLTKAKRQDRNEDIAVSHADIAIDLALSPQIGGRIPRAIMQQILSALADCTDVQLDNKPISIGEPGSVLHIRVEDHEQGFILFAEQDESISTVYSNGAVLQDGILRAIGDPEISNRDIDELHKGRIFSFDQVADLVGRVIPTFQDRVPVDIRSTVLPTATAIEPRISFNVDYDGDCLSVLATLIYGDPPSARVDAGRLHYLGGPLPLRNERKEKLLVDELSYKTDIEIGKTHHYRGLDSIKLVDSIRLIENATIQGNGLDSCFISEPLEMSFSSQETDFDLSFTSQGDGIVRHASPQAVVKAWQCNESLVPLKEGGWAPIPNALLERCGEILADLLAFKSETQKLPQCAIPDLVRLCEALEVQHPPDFGKLRSLVEDFEGIPETDLPDDLQAVLRSYQKQGVNWLSFLSKANLGALLADDMGLGKTIQALCVIGYPCLVVAPASVLHNWVNEIDRFRPSLSINVYHGPNRKLDHEVDITLTTYTILRIDEEALTTRSWDTVVLDEAQNIKNADSQVANAAFRLQARFRVTLSGTPVENRLDELWSQFHFINRGLLGSREDFRNRYAKPITEGNEDTITRLRQRIRPFVLRRLKRDVAKELPPRTEVVLYCDLDQREREIYEAIHAATQREIINKLKAGGNVMAAFEALLRLRQACCHPALIPGQEANNSSKLILLMDTLDNVIAEGHKALVFSQWTSLLDLVEPHLNASNIHFTRLDGSTRNRGEVVSTFQSDSGPEVMLISLRAGGTGLNLTAADNIFLLDPWWNPAVEDQAADRTHRIGQHKPVLVQRLVVENSVEEGMLKLQQRKRLLARAAIEGSYQEQGLTREDLLELLN